MRRFWNFVAGDDIDPETGLPLPPPPPEDDAAPVPDPVPTPVPPPSAESESTDGYDVSPVLGSHTLLYCVSVLEPFARTGLQGAGGALMHADAVRVLRELAELMVWADQKDVSVWDCFMECAVMGLLVRCLRATSRIESRIEAAAIGVAHDAGDDISTPVQGRVHGSEGAPSSIQKTADGAEQTDRHEKSEAQQPARERAARENADSEVPAPTSPREESADADSAECVGDDDRGESFTLLSQSALADAIIAVQSQLLQTLSIMVQSVSRQQSLYCLFAGNHINELLSFAFHFEHDEILAYFMSAVKSIAIKLDPTLLQLFYDPLLESFPLYTAVTTFYDHSEGMIRIAVRNVTLSIYALGSQEVQTFAIRDPNRYLDKTVVLLGRLCGSVARALEIILDDGREVRRTRTRTGLFRRKVRLSDVAQKLSEIENLCGYLGDVATLAGEPMKAEITRLLCVRFFSPLFRPIASQASPTAMILLRRWRLRSGEVALNSAQPALALFDAAARALLLTCLLNYLKASSLAHGLIQEMCRPVAEFESRHVVHGLTAMASDLSGTERVTNIALCALESFVSCEHVALSTLGELQLLFDLATSDDESSNSSDSAGELLHSPATPKVETPEDAVVAFGRVRSQDEPMLMTLMDFEAPLTPSTSHPGTPTLHIQRSGSGAFSKNNSADFGHQEWDGNGSQSPNRSSSSSLSPRHPPSDEAGILLSFRRGDATLREVLSSILLVVRKREVRTLRVVQAVGRIVSVIGKRSGDWVLSVDVAKIMLDELASGLSAFLANKRTTIVSIERAFKNYKLAAVPESPPNALIPELYTLLSPDTLPHIASDLPTGAGRRRRVLADDATPPTEIEDATGFFVLLHVYENASKAAGIGNCVTLYDQALRILMDKEADGSYLDKRDALSAIADAVLTHGPVMQ